MVVTMVRDANPIVGSPKRHYYLQSARGNRLFELGLAPVALALCGSSDPGAPARIDEVPAGHGPGQFAEAFLRNCDLGWAADIVAGSPDPQAPQEGAE